MAEQTNLIGGEEAARLLAHPLPNLKWAVYASAEAERPVAIFESHGMAKRWALDEYETLANVREILTFSDRMPVARWRADS